MGISNIIANTEILAALNPLYAFTFLRANGWFAFIALGAVVLALTHLVIHKSASLTTPAENPVYFQ